MEALKHENAIELITILIVDGGADIEKRWRGKTIFQIAVESDRIDIAEVLLELGADVNQTYVDRDGVVSTLASPFLLDGFLESTFTYTPLELAKSDEMRSLLKGYGCKIIFNLKSWDYLDKLMPKKG